MKNGIGKGKVLERSFRLVHLKGGRDITSIVAVVVKQRVSAHETVVYLFDVIKAKVSNLRERHNALAGGTCEFRKKVKDGEDIVHKARIITYVNIKKTRNRNSRGCLQIANLLLMLLQKSTTRSWSFSGLATMVRIMLMYYIDVHGFLEHPEKDWEKALEKALEAPPESEQN